MKRNTLRIKERLYKDKDKIIELFNKGKEIKELVAIEKTSYSTMCHYLDKWGLKKIKKHKKNDFSYKKNNMVIDEVTKVAMKYNNNINKKLVKQYHDVKDNFYPEWERMLPDAMFEIKV